MMCAHSNTFGQQALTNAGGTLSDMWVARERGVATACESGLISYIRRPLTPLILQCMLSRLSWDQVSEIVLSSCLQELIMMHDASLYLSSRPDSQWLDRGDAARMAVQLLAHVHTLCLVLDRGLSGGLRDGVYVSPS